MINAAQLRAGSFAERFQGRESWLFIGVSVFLASMYLLFLNPNVDLQPFNAHDSVAYLSRASSLWNGRGYGETFVDAFFPVTLQPPGFSILLAPVVGIFGMNFAVLKLFMLILSGLMAYSCFRFFNYFLSCRKAANRALLLFMASPVIFGLSHQVLAEVPLFLGCAASLVVFNRYLRPSEDFFSPLFPLSAALIVVSYFIKPTALGILAGGWLLFFHPKFCSPRTLKKLLLCTLLIGIPIFIWQVWCSAIPKTNFWTQSAWNDVLLLNPYQFDSPRASLADIAVRMRHNLAWGLSANFAMGLIAPFYFSQGGLPSFLFSLLFVIYFIWMWFKSFVQNPSVLEGFVLFGASLLMIKFEGMAVRYGALLYPALIVYAFRGLSSYFGDRAQAFIATALLILALSTTCAVALEHWSNPYGGTIVRDYVAAAKKAKQFFPSNSSCSAPMATHWQILTEHQCFSSNEKAISTKDNGSLTSADYFVIFSDTAPQDFSRFKDFESHIMRSTSGITGRVKKSTAQFETIYRNNTFALVKAVPHVH